jgi:metal-responsive CopG/Arc/MetJ family transcriptional regulator
MPAKPVQVSIDTELLGRIDDDPETRTHGRSAFVRAAVEHYLVAKQRRQIDAQIAVAYGGRADDLLAEIADLMGAQAWPED